MPAQDSFTIELRTQSGDRKPSTKLRKAERKMGGVMANMRPLMRAVLSSLRFYAPKDTGVFAEGLIYRESFHAQANYSADGNSAGGTDLAYEFWATGDHAFVTPFLLEGTQAHVIPTGGAAAQMAKGYPLHWVDKATGEHHFAWSVWHPGTMPSFFVSNALDAMQPILEGGIQEAARDIVWNIFVR